MEATCPRCGCIFDQPRNKDGAGYASHLKQLSPKRYKLLVWWWNRAAIDNGWMSKKQLSIQASVAFGTVGGAVPEFKKLRLVENMKNFKAPDGQKSLFRLDIKRAAVVINANGNLDVLRTTTINLQEIAAA